MSTTIDNKVVEMRFDNKQFETATAQSMSTIDKLKSKLAFTGATKGLSDIDSSIKKVDMSGFGSAVDTVSARFSALQVVGITALANITNSAVNAGKRIISALTIDPIKTGFQEYETQINAIQTILANTESKGTTLKDVNNALDELNLYADKTIYNFTEMTRNIGTFTAAGVGLKESTTAIQGIANLAAVSGSTSQQASAAMYQLSQALAAGTVKLMDWNSVVNAGMGGQVFQDALKKTARAHGVAVDDMIKKNGSFRESLQEGWITSEILTETLAKMTQSGAAEYLSKLTGVSQDQIEAAQKMVDANKDGSASYDKIAEKMAKTGKISKKEAMEILKMADTATNAATKVKTFTQLWDTLKEAAQSGWTQTWEIIVGDFEESKSMLTAISDTVSNIINKTSEARNKVLQGWKDLGGRNDLLEGFKNVFKSISDIIKSISEAFKEIIPPVTAKKLFAITEGFKKLTESFKISDETADKLKRTFKGLFSIVDLFRKVVLLAAQAIGSLFTSGLVSGLIDIILSVTAVIGDIFTALNSGISLDGFSGIFKGIADIVAGVLKGLTGFEGALSSIGESVSNIIGGIFDGFKTVFGWIKDNVSFGDIFAGLAGGGIFLAAKKIGGAFEKIEEVFSGGLLGLIFGSKKGDVAEKVKMADKFKEVLGSVNESLGAFTNGIKIGSLVAIASAIAILSAALKNVASLNLKDATKSLFAIGIMFTMLTTSFKSISKSLDIFSGKGIIKSGIAMMMMAKAINILAEAMKEMANLSFPEIIKGLIGIGGGMTALTLGLKAINGVKIKVSTLLAIGLLADAIKKIGNSLVELGSMSWGEIGRGLSAMAGALTIFTITLKALDKVGSFKSIVGGVGLVIAVQSLDEIANALSKIGTLSWGEIARGLSGMGGALAELSVIMGLLGKLGGFSSIIGSVAISEGARSLADIASALSEIGILSWSEIIRGLSGMGGALTELAVISGLLGTLTGMSGLIGAASIVIAVRSLGDIAKAFQAFVGITWDEIKMGLVGMGGALAEVSIFSGSLGILSGFSGILGSGAILIAVQGLGDIADALKKLGEMSWSEIGTGLAAMGGALVEIAAVTGVLGTLAGAASLLGAGSIYIAVQGLGDIADALKKLGEMSWSEIGRGLAAMGAALGELALGGLLNTLSIIGASSISKMAEPLGLLADSVKKWSDVKVPATLGLQLGLLADGIMSFTLGGFGASAIAEVAGPLGTLANSVKKWNGVTVPETLGPQLKSLYNGVKSFTFGGLGASAIAEVAAPLGTLANSVKKWNGVTIPEGMNKQLSSLSNGVKSFTWAFVGGWSLSTITKPLGDLANSIKQWNGVKIPEGLSDGLSDLSNGVKSFTWAFVGGWSLSAITGPLGDLAKAVKKWNGVTIPEGLASQLKSLAKAVKAFSGVKDISGATKGLGSLASSSSKLSGIKFGSINSGIKGLAKALTTLGNSKDSISGVGSAISKNIITPIKNLGPKLTKVGSNLSSSLAKGMKSSTAVKSAVSNIVSAAAKSANSKAETFRSAGKKLGSSLSSGIKDKLGSVKTTVESVCKKAKSAVTNYKSGFESAGRGLGDGLIKGIRSKKSAAYSEALAIGRTAAEGVKKGAKINSPSKLTIPVGEGIGEGVIVGMKKIGSEVVKSGYAMGQESAKSVARTLSSIGTIIDSGVDVQPTIRPVLDLSDIKSGAGAINGMLGQPVSVGANLSAINYGMNRRSQNGVNDDVISAIDNLRKDLSASGGDSYQINGITYDDGSNVADAIKTIVRAAKVERRK